jgi:hypothetical protein
MPAETKFCCFHCHVWVREQFSKVFIANNRLLLFCSLIPSMSTHTRTTKPNNHVPIYLFVPNIIGYIRLLCLVIAAFIPGIANGTASPFNLQAFLVLVFLWGVLDIADGAVARALNQTSRFGAFLDVMIDNCGR